MGISDWRHGAALGNVSLGANLGIGIILTERPAIRVGTISILPNSQAFFPSEKPRGGVWRVEYREESREDWCDVPFNAKGAKRETYSDRQTGTPKPGKRLGGSVAVLSFLSAGFAALFCRLCVKMPGFPIG